MAISIVLYTRDLRVHDNPALDAAVRRGQVVPVFVLDDALLSGRCGAPNRLASGQVTGSRSPAYWTGRDF